MSFVTSMTTRLCVAIVILIGVLPAVADGRYAI